MAADALITTPGAANANAYCDVAFADQYHANRPPVGVTWASASTDQKNAAILWATILMDRLWHWNGYVVDTTQILLWPRQNMLEPNQLQFVPITEIPIQLKQATAEYARQLLVADLAGNSDIETLGITQFKAGPVAFSFKNDVVAKAVPDTVYNLIPPDWGYVRGRSTGVRNLQRA